MAQNQFLRQNLFQPPKLRARFIIIPVRGSEIFCQLIEVVRFVSNLYLINDEKY